MPRFKVTVEKVIYASVEVEAVDDTEAEDLAVDIVNRAVRVGAPLVEEQGNDYADVVDVEELDDRES